IKVVSRRGEVVTKVWVTKRVPPGVLFMTLHYRESPTNVLTNGAYDKVTKTYEYKVCGVRVEALK
ncbi:MAG: molybdopterin dinucleotide binding domain-containing protein, partial [Bacillota bacterium]